MCMDKIKFWVLLHTLNMASSLAYGPVDFWRAFKLCDVNNASFVSIHSAKENRFINSFRLRYGPVPVWIGMYREATRRKWVDDSDIDYMAQYSSNIENSACVYMFNTWVEGKCENNLFFVCEKKMNNKDKMCEKHQPGTINNTIPYHIVPRPSTPYYSEDNDNDKGHDASTQQSGNTERHGVTKVSDGGSNKVTLYDVIAFGEVLETLKYKKPPRQVAKEAPGSQAIGTVAIMILCITFFGIVLLDINTIKNHLKILFRNISGGCRHTVSALYIYVKDIPTKTGNELH